MGTDWHPILEKRTETGWEPLWEPTLDSDWYERILDDANENEIGQLLTFSQDEDVAYKALEAHFQAMTREEVEAKYGDDPRVIWRWREASYEGNDYSKFAFKQRDYSWFGAIAGLSKKAQLSFEQWSGDAHTEGCLMVDAILNCEAMQRYQQTKWLRENVPDPANTRLIFWFDN